MGRFTKLFLINAFLFLFSIPIFANSASNGLSIVGYWQTIDGKTHKPSSIIKIQPVGAYYTGTIIKTYAAPDPKNADHTMPIDKTNKQKSALGLVIINGMRCSRTFCQGGTILDPRNEKLYHATMKLIDKGRKLKVRGYIGMPLFGKTVVWIRVTDQQAGAK